MGYDVEGPTSLTWDVRFVQHYSVDVDPWNQEYVFLNVMLGVSLIPPSCRLQRWALCLRKKQVVLIQVSEFEPWVLGV